MSFAKKTCCNNAVFKQTGLTTKNRKDNCIKVFSCCQARTIFSLWRG